VINSSHTIFRCRFFPSTVLKTHSNLPTTGPGGLGTIPEDASVKGGIGPGGKPMEVNVKKLSDDISHLGVGDDSVFGDVESVGFKSEYQKAVEKGEKVSKVKTLRGNTQCGLPYIVDLWRDCNGRVRVSIQVWMLSGDDFHTKVLGRVSSGLTDFVLAFPMDAYMERSDLAFSTFIMDQSKLASFQKEALLYVIKNHPKSIARIQSVALVKQRQCVNEGACYYEMRIPRSVIRSFATSLDGDTFFNGLKFVKYANGTVYLHAELMGELKDSYTPQERKQAPMTRVAKSLEVDVPIAMEVSSGPKPFPGGATVIDNAFQTDDGSRG